MSDPFPGLPPSLEPEPESLVHVDPTLDRREARWRWEVRAAQWRARELAESVFAGAVSARLAGPTVKGSFRGLLHLDVPFRDIDSHCAREAVFKACATADPVLGRIPLVYVLTPVPR